MVAVSHPIVDESPHESSNDKFLGVVALMVEVGGFVELSGGDGQFAVLVDQREGDHTGLILQHPLYDRLMVDQGEIPERFTNEEYRVGHAQLLSNLGGMRGYRDPLAADPKGGQYRKRWLAQVAPVLVREEETGLVVIVQEPYDRAIGSPLAELRSGLVFYGLAATAMVVLVVCGLWTLAIHLLKEASPTRLSVPAGDWTERSTTSVTPEAPTDTHQRAVD